MSTRSGRFVSLATRGRPARPRLAPRGLATLLTLLLLSTLLLSTTAVPVWGGDVREVVLLYTNDFHSAFDPIPAYWLPGDPPPNLGGAAELMTLVEEIRDREHAAGNPVFLFDTGDMFTGMLAKLTEGEALMEMMATMRYDAMAIGNHEFDYGWQNFRRQMHRVSFPVLGANIFYADTEVPFSPPHTILEKDGVRLGVIGVIGQDARSVILPSLVEALRFDDPAPRIRSSIAELRDDVDVTVVLAHQGHTGPMQTDAEAHPEIQRDFDADVALSGEVEGIDVFVGGHAHRGIEEPFVHPDTGTLIVQTYGYGTRLGYLRLWVDVESNEVVRHEGELMKVWSDELEPDPRMVEKIARYRAEVAPIIGPVVGQARQRLVRSYNTESSLGSFCADVLREVGKAEVGFCNAGGLRDDLPAGEITVGDVQDAFPFYNTLAVLEMTGEQIAAVVEQGLTLLRGMIQVSGLEILWDPQREPGERLVELSVGGEPVEPERRYRVATNSFLAEGGDLYGTFEEADWVETAAEDVATVILRWLKRQTEPVPRPATGRIRVVAAATAADAR